MGIFLDLEKAFDMTWRTGIQLKLRDLGISGNMFAYVLNLQKDTYMRVRARYVLSEVRQIENGVLQGSAISPLLFIIAMNDIATKLRQVDHLLFADDATIYVTGRHIDRTVDILQRASYKIQKWAEAWVFGFLLKNQ